MAYLVAEKAQSKTLKSRPAEHVRVGLVQARSTLGTELLDPREDNLGRALETIRKLSKDGVQLAVFGELYLTGYRTDEWLHKWATSLYPPDDHVQQLCACAKENQIHILMGAATTGRFMPGDIYNSVLFVGPEGLIGVHHKCHVAAFPANKVLATERCFYSPGKEVPVFDSSLCRIGVHICWDMAFPEVSRVQTLKGAEMLINCAASVAGFEEWWDFMVPARAAENMTWYMTCSVVGEQRDFKLFGGSRIADPDGRIVAAAKHHQEDILVADIDLGLSRRIRATSHMFSARQPELYRAITETNPYP